MFEKPQAPHTLGIDLDSFLLKGVALSLEKNQLKLDRTFEFIIETAPDENGNVKPLYTTDQIQQLESLSDHKLIVSAADTQDILVRPLDLKLKKEKDIEDTLAFHVEPLLPYPVENAVIDKVTVSKDNDGSKLTVFSIRKDHLTQHIDRWTGLEINPEVVSAAPQALVLFANKFVESENPFFVVHLAIEHSLAVLIDQKKLLAAQAIPSGLNPLIDAIAKEKNLDKVSAYTELCNTSFGPHSTENPSVKSALDELRMSITRTLYSLAKQFKGREVKDLIITGPGAVIEGLTDTFVPQLNKSLLSIKEDQASGTSKNELLNYALPIGAALSALPNTSDQINFRQGEFSYPEPWKRLKQPIMQYFLLSLGVATALFLFGKAYVSYKEGEVRQEYLNLLDVMNKPYTTFEQQFTGKSASEIAKPDVAALNMNDIESRLNFLEKDIKSTPQTFQLRPDVPLVTDVLAWISSHPNFIGKQHDGSILTSSSMHIENFSYSMVKRPEPTKKQEKYQVKVEMEFSSPTPMMAREFHDALIAPNDMVDPKAEIKWNSNRNIYRTSFYLKDKTVYPNL